MRILKRDVVVKILLTSILYGSVPVKKRFGEILQDVDLVNLLSVGNEIELREHAESAESGGVNFAGSLDDVDGRDVDVSGLPASRKN